MNTCLIKDVELETLLGKYCKSWCFKKKGENNEYSLQVYPNIGLDLKRYIDYVNSIKVGGYFKGDQPILQIDNDPEIRFREDKKRTETAIKLIIRGSPKLFLSEKRLYQKRQTGNQLEYYLSEEILFDEKDYLVGDHTAKIFIKMKSKAINKKTFLKALRDRKLMWFERVPKKNSIDYSFPQEEIRVYRLVDLMEFMNNLTLEN